MILICSQIWEIQLECLWLVKQLKILGEFLMNKDAEWCEIKLTTKLWVLVTFQGERIILKE